MDNRRSDLEINNNVRRELVILRIDQNSLKYGSAGGNVYISGELKFTSGEKTGREMAKFLKKLEDHIKAIQGVKAVDVKVKGWEKTPGGDWVSLDGAAGKAQEIPQPSAPAAPPKPVITNINIKNISVVDKKCPKCERIVTRGIKFCEECGEKLELEQLRRQIAKCDKCNIVMRGDIHFCSKCGTSLKPMEHKTIVATCKKCGFTKNKSLNFCGDCGTSLTENYEKKTKTASAPQPVHDLLDDKIEQDIKNMQEQQSVIDDINEDEGEEKLSKKDKILRLLEQGKQDSLNKSKWKV